MNKLLSLTTAFALLLVANEGYGMGKQKMKVSEINGVTETQISKNDQRARVMVRGKAAELLYSTMREERPMQTDSDALRLIGTHKNAHWSVQGRQVSCSRIVSKAKGKDDFACSFEIDEKGAIAKGVEPFDPTVFNLARTETGIKFHNGKKANRSLASVETTPVAYSKGNAYLMYEESKKRKPSEDAMIVFRGESAKEIMKFLAEAPGARKYTFWGGPKGVKGREIACVAATKREPERCALVVTLKDGSISRSSNPLFR